MELLSILFIQFHLGQKELQEQEEEILHLEVIWSLVEAGVAEEELLPMLMQADQAEAEAVFQIVLLEQAIFMADIILSLKVMLVEQVKILQLVVLPLVAEEHLLSEQIQILELQVMEEQAETELQIQLQEHLSHMVAEAEVEEKLLLELVELVVAEQDQQMVTHLQELIILVAEAVAAIIMLVLVLVQAMAEMVLFFFVSQLQIIQELVMLAEKQLLQQMVAILLLNGLQVEVI